MRLHSSFHLNLPQITNSSTLIFQRKIIGLYDINITRFDQKQKKKSSDRNVFSLSKFYYCIFIALFTFMLFEHIFFWRFIIYFSYSVSFFKDDCYWLCIYNDTCLNRSSLEPSCVFRIDRCSVYTVTPVIPEVPWDQLKCSE